MTDNAASLRDLHRPGDPLLLPNVWDAGSAKIVQEAGFPALATASAAVSAMLGYPDHEGAPAEEMFAAAGRVIRAATVPVTVDAEAGYGLQPGELVERLLAIGAAGCNLEDTYAGELAEPRVQAEYIAAVREAAGDALVINARADVFVARAPDPVEAAIARGRLYLEAGADCVYPIAAPPDAIPALVKGIPGPVNANNFPGTSLAELAELGVARVSYGPMPYLRALDSLKEFAGRVLAKENPYT
ncbi:2-methylisocitrate lyase-like PEP mutase family enzyme [Actinomadura coerulea]|uniref:2-methylisocitrate lyase-like PEP mutase family enzyme n=1 Tax=Actinomadura coerulea TaxID=46159 RepID=A0A7X0G6T8_9ACTN|nr:isocitrate lyase/phosphoenolpyruvate mutase family protein [Actinomadura coerulea]MBB6399326.1 2-methylisocitrate lyase-like PEP mutase family enzyme [Actinomadura coerulea]GGQ28108.1 carboxyvinyl-carboxyphosphonate phosphorylmutase [Actinomadura coerulea]